jgi:hypothetical protein
MIQGIQDLVSRSGVMFGIHGHPGAPDLLAYLGGPALGVTSATTEADASGSETVPWSSSITFRGAINEGSLPKGTSGDHQGGGGGGRSGADGGGTDEGKRYESVIIEAQYEYDQVGWGRVGRGWVGSGKSHHGKCSQSPSQSLWYKLIRFNSSCRCGTLSGDPLGRPMPCL